MTACTWSVKVKKLRMADFIESCIVPILPRFSEDADLGRQADRNDTLTHLRIFVAQELPLVFDKGERRMGVPAASE